MMRISLSFIISSCFVFLSGCTNNPNVTNDDEIITKRERPYANMKKFFGEEALLFSNDSNFKNIKQNSVISVNAYLWRASLDIVSFMGLQSVDPFGGVIITEWFTPAHTPHERVKVTVSITGTRLNAAALKVTVVRQQIKNAQWINVQVDPDTALALEDAILTKSRQLKINGM